MTVGCARKAIDSALYGSPTGGASPTAAGEVSCVQMYPSRRTGKPGGSALRDSSLGDDPGICWNDCVGFDSDVVSDDAPAVHARTASDDDVARENRAFNARAGADDGPRPDDGRGHARFRPYANPITNHGIRANGCTGRQIDIGTDECGCANSGRNVAIAAQPHVAAMRL